MLDSFFTSAIPNEDTTNSPVFKSCRNGIVIENFGITEALVEKLIQGPDNNHQNLLLVTINEVYKPL